MPTDRGPHPDDLMTTGEAARVLGLSVDMVRLLERYGRLSAERTTSGLRLFRRSTWRSLQLRAHEQHRAMNRVRLPRTNQPARATEPGGANEQKAEEDWKGR